MESDAVSAIAIGGYLVRTSTVRPETGASTTAEAALDRTTREFCQRCNRVSAVGFHAETEIWRAVAGRWQHSILCLSCFAQLGDEKHVQWEKGMEFYPVSYATHHAARGGHIAFDPVPAGVGSAG